MRYIVVFIAAIIGVTIHVEMNKKLAAKMNLKSGYRVASDPACQKEVFVFIAGTVSLLYIIFSIQKYILCQNKTLRFPAQV